jgi:hypothetical protein
MKLTSNPKNTSEKLGVSDAKEFTIDTSNQMIVSILRDRLYENKVAAVCREVSSNCRDANREAGKPNAPVIITIGQEDSMLGDETWFISFKDSGIGISPDRIENVFLKYGSSTKRDSNNQTGGFGIGAKTPFAYTNEFIIETVSDDGGKLMKHTYQAAILNENGNETSQLILISDEVTNEATGTTITVPIKSKDRSDFENECERATLLWETQPTLKGFATELPELTTLKKGEGWKMVYGKRINNILNASQNGLILQVDGIPYPIPNIPFDNIYNDLRNSRISKGCRDPYFCSSLQRNVVLEFKTGELSLSASREGIESTEANLILIVERHNSMIEDIKKEGIKMYKKAKTDLEKAAFFNDMVTYKNKTIKDKESKDFKNFLSRFKMEEFLGNEDVNLKSLPKNLHNLGSKKLNFTFIKNVRTDSFSFATKHINNDKRIDNDVINNILFIIKSVKGRSNSGKNKAIKAFCNENGLTTAVFVSPKSEYIFKEEVDGVETDFYKEAIDSIVDAFKSSSVNYQIFEDIVPVKTVRDPSTYVKKTKEERAKGNIYTRELSQDSFTFFKGTRTISKNDKTFIGENMVESKTVVLVINDRYTLSELDKVSPSINQVFKRETVSSNEEREIVRTIEEISDPSLTSETQYNYKFVLSLLSNRGYRVIAVTEKSFNSIKNDTNVIFGFKNALNHLASDKEFIKECKIVSKKSAIERMTGFLKGDGNHDVYYSRLGRAFLLLGGLDLKKYKTFDASKVKGGNYEDTKLYKFGGWQFSTQISLLAEEVVKLKCNVSDEKYKGYMTDDVIKECLELIKVSHPMFHYLFIENEISFGANNWRHHDYDFEELKGVDRIAENLLTSIEMELVKNGIEPPKKRGRKKME